MEIIDNQQNSLIQKENLTDEEKIFLGNIENLQLVSIAKKEEELFLP